MASLQHLPPIAAVTAKPMLHHSVLSMASPWSHKPALDLADGEKMHLGIWCHLGTQALQPASEGLPEPGSSSPLANPTDSDAGRRMNRAARIATSAESSPAVRLMGKARDLQDLVRRWNALSAHSSSHYHSRLEWMANDVIRVEMDRYDAPFLDGASVFLGHVVASAIERMGGTAEPSISLRHGRLQVDVAIHKQPGQSVKLPLLNGLDESDVLVQLVQRVLYSLDDTWSLKKAANCLNMSERNFQRKLASSQLSWPLLLRAIRLHAAVDAVIDTREPLTTIAHRCGFSDSAHFSRLFKQAACLSPVAYRELSLGSKGR
jgi:AraC-like DNA-binding protein